jgi:hypothetical protein
VWLRRAGDTATGAISVPDDPYAAGWNGSTQVPTKNAVYDKIELIASGTGITQAAADVRYLQLTGGTLTGDVTMTKATPALSLNTNAAATQQAQLSFKDNGTQKWDLHKTTDNQLAARNEALTRDEQVWWAAGGTTLVSLAGTGTRAVEASSLGFLTATTIQGMDLISTTSPSAVASQSINSCFSATYESYIVVARLSMSASTSLNARLRVGGADNTTSAYYSAVDVISTGAPANTSNGQTAGTSWTLHTASGVTATDLCLTFNLFSPFATDETIGHHTDNGNYVTGTFSHRGGHAFRATTSFDGLTILPGSGTITGTIRVYGLRN